MPTQTATAEGIHPYLLGTDTPVGVDEQGTKWSVSYRGKNAILVATFEPGVSLEFKIPTSSVNKSGSVAAFTIPNFGDAQWVTHAEHVKFEVRFPTAPKVSEVSLNIARQGCDITPDGNGGLLVSTSGRQVGALPRPWIEYVPDGSQDRVRLWLDWVVAEPMMKLTMPTLSQTEWQSAVLDPTVITTSTASTATAYSNQRKIDRTSNGVLWAMYWDGTSGTGAPMRFRYSTDDGATWSDGGGFGFAGTGTTYVPNGSLFIDLDDYAHVAYKDRHSGHTLYRRGTPNAGRTAYTWSAAETVYGNTFSDYPDVVAHREGTGWRAHIVRSHVYLGALYAYYRGVSIDSAGALTLDATTETLGTYSTSNHAHPSIDFNHTGDGKTVAGTTPHLYAAWSAGATGSGLGIRFKKATYSGGSWAWGTEREIDSTSFANGGRISSAFNGSQCVIGYADSASTSSIKVRERDAADTTTTTRTPTSLSDGVVTGLSVSYDDSGNIHLGAVGTTSDDVKSLKYDRTAGTWGAWETVATATAGADTLSLERGYSNSAVGLVYTDGTASPYSVTYDSISLGPPTIAVDLLPATEATTAQPLRRVKRRALGVATDTSIALPLARSKTRAVGVATETTTARPIVTRPRIIVALGVAVETTTAQPVVARFPDVLYQFTPPTQIEKIKTDRLFSRYGIPVGMTVAKVDGVFTVTPYPWLGDLADLEAGVEYFLGGRDYTISKSVALELQAAGFEVTRLSD